MRPLLNGKRLAAAVLLATATGSASAAGVLIGPLRLELGVHTPRATLSFTNSGERSIDLETDVQTWTQQDDGNEVKTPSDDIVISPAFATVPPGKTQLFRLAMRQPLPPAAERAYRVLLSDVSDDAEETPASLGENAIKLRFPVTHSLPLFLQTLAESEPAKLAMDACPAPAGEVCLRVRNTGEHHTGLNEITLNSDGWKQQISPHATLLAGGTLLFKVAAPQLKSSLVEVSITADDGTTVNASVNRAQP